MAGNSKEPSVTKIVRQGLGYVGSAIGSYISEAMPVTGSTASDIGSTAKELQATFSRSSKSAVSKVRELRKQANFRNIVKWFMASEDDLDNIGSFGADLDFDTDSRDDSATATLAEIEVTETEKSANKISKSVIQSNHQLVESQIASTANIVNAVNDTTVAVVSGFDRVTGILNSIQETLAKNTSALIEQYEHVQKLNQLEMAQQKTRPGDAMLGEGKFKLSSYKDMLKSNFNDSEVGMYLSMLSTMKSMMSTTGGVSAKDVVELGVHGIIDKFLPMVKENLKSVDDLINDTIMDQLIKLGDDSKGGHPFLKRLFGINSTRQNLDTSKTTLELKPIPFDSITKEAIVTTIPGYLREILKAVSGKDQVYDYRNRSFRSPKDIEKEFRSVVTQANNIHNSPEIIQDALGVDYISSLIYDLMQLDIGSNGNIQDLTKSLKDKKSAKKYVKNLISDIRFSKDERARALEVASGLSDAVNAGAMPEIVRQAKQGNVYRTHNGRDYIHMANMYGVDLSSIVDSESNDRNEIIRQHGVAFKKNTQSSNQTLSGKRSEDSLIGTDYTNKALYEIYRRLDNGLNVFVVGNQSLYNRPFEKFQNKYLEAPAYIKTRQINQSNSFSSESTTREFDEVRQVFFGDRPEGEPNYLKNQVDEDGVEENLGTGERILRWGKYRGRQLRGALFSSDKDALKNVLSGSISDIKEVSKKGVEQLNQSFGNVSGSLKHKLLGTGYSYQEYDEEGNTVTKQVQENKGGGVVGLIKDKFADMFDNAKNSSRRWIGTVKQYFDYSDGEPKNGKVANLRKKILGTSIGAFAGAGILGGPLGLITGTLAGAALSSTGLGDKIKEMLFGRDEKDGKATGILSRVGDAIMIPIRYQLGKTTHALGSMLKKNILGPLSDLGFAIKERIMNHVESTFGKALKRLGSLFLKPFQVLGKAGAWLSEKLFGVSVDASGKAIRGVAGGATGTFGALTEGLANIVAGSSESRKKISERKKDRDKEIKESDRQFKDSYGSKEAFKKNYRLRKLNDRDEFRRRISETFGDDIIPEKTQNDISHTAEVLDKNNELIEKNAEISQKTQEGVYKRLDSIIQYLTGTKYDPSSQDVSTLADRDKDVTISDEGFANGALNALTTAATQNGLTDDEANDINGSIDEIAKPHPDRNKIKKDLKEVINSNVDKKEVEMEKESPIISMISGIVGGIGGILGGLLGGFSSNWPVLLAAVAGLSALFMNPNGLGTTIESIGNVIGNIGDGIGKILGANQKKGSTTLTGVNAATGIVDVQANSLLDYTIPGASLYHNNVDGAGDQIVNKTATEAKEEVLWKTPLRRYLNGSSDRYTAKQDRLYDKALSKYEKADSLRAEADALASEGGIANKIKAGTKKGQAKIADKQGEKLEKRGDVAGEKASEIAGGPATSIKKGLARVGTLTAVSGLAGKIGSSVAGSMGMDEETADRVGSITSAATSAGLTVNMATSAAKGKTSIVDKIIDGVKKMLEFIAKKCKADKALQKVASKIDNIINTLLSGLLSGIKKMGDKLITKLEAVLAKYGIKASANALTLGAGYVVGAVSGLASGVCGTEHLFGVLPNEADAGMVTISAVMGTVFGALEWDPAIGWAVAMIDVLDTVLIGIFGCGLKQYIARGLYQLIGGEQATATLAEKQSKFDSEKELYNQKYGTDLTTAQFNDKVNRTGWWDQMWNGKQQYDNEGHLKFDDAGGDIPGGIRGAFEGERAYLKDASGNIIRDTSGTAVLLRDEKGHVVKKEMKLGDHVSNFFSDVGSFFGGQTTYKTDENGNAIWDEEAQSYVVDKQGKNLIDRVKDGVGGFLADTAEGIVNFFGFDTGKKKLEEEMRQAAEAELADASGEEKKTDFNTFLKDAIGNVTNFMISPVSAIVDGITEINKDEPEYEMGPDGKPLTDSNGKPIKKGNIKNFLLDGVAKVVGIMTNPVKGITEAITGITSGDNNNFFGGIKDWWDGLWGNGKGGSDDDSITPASQSSNRAVPHSSTTTVEGGNPLSIPISQKSQLQGGNVSDPYGSDAWRANYTTLGNFHRGIDLVPSWSQNDGSDIDVINRYTGKVVGLERNVSDNDKAIKDDNGNWRYRGNHSMGNYVRIETPDGKQITSMHLKNGSIPSNIQIGSEITPGTKIGIMGTTGWSTGRHLHYQIDDLNLNSDGNKQKSIDPTNSVFGGETVTAAGEYDATTADSTVKRAVSGNVRTITSEERSNFLSYGREKSRGSDWLDALTAISQSLGWKNSENKYMNTNANGDTANTNATSLDHVGNSEGSVTVPNNYGLYELWEPEMVGAGNNASNWESQRRHSTHGWARASNQGALRKDAIASGRYKGKNKYGMKNISTIDDRILVATNQNIGNKLPVEMGDHVDIHVKGQNGKKEVWNAMIADSKDDAKLTPAQRKKAQLNEWGHKNGENVVELIYDKKPKGDGNQYKKVEKIVKSGQSYQPSGKGGGDEKSSINPRIHTVDHRNSASSTSTYTAVGSQTQKESSELKELLAAFLQVIPLLRTIATNTGASTEQLESLNSKGFADSELRTALNSIKAVNKTPAVSQNSQSNQSVLALARP